MSSEMHFDPGRRVKDEPPPGRGRLPYWDLDKPDPVRGFSDAGVRRFDVASRTWMLVRWEPEPVVVANTCRPVGDGSGVFWEIAEWDHGRKRFGQVMWTVEAASLDRAIAEKVRLCIARGFRPGWGRVRAAP